MSVLVETEEEDNPEGAEEEEKDLEEGGGPVGAGKEEEDSEVKEDPVGTIMQRIIMYFKCRPVKQSTNQCQKQKEKRRRKP